MFTSPADVFRTRQAVADLLDVVHLHRSAVSRIGATNAEVASIDLIVENGGIIPDEKSRFYSSILLAAAMPDEDFNSFVVATSILLTDRLQDGGGEENLYWNYEAFSDHYLLADAPVRAALMNAFRIAYRTGTCSLPEEPSAHTCLTRSKQDALVILGSERAEDLIAAVESNPSEADAGAMWNALAPKQVTLAARVGFRYLYERPSSLAPEHPDQAALIPWR
ncbi:MAG: hypothetical protein AAF718_00500 [Pseudomonadota bacterium]